MKLNAIISMVGLSAILLASSFSASAISHKHREELAKSHCTQVQEANGECDVAKAQVGNKTITKHFNGLTIVWKQNESVTVDGKLADVIESGGYGATWQQGIYKIITYKNNKIAVMQGDKFLGYAK